MLDTHTNANAERTQAVSRSLHVLSLFQCTEHARLYAKPILLSASIFSIIFFVCCFFFIIIYFRVLFSFSSFFCMVIWIYCSEPIKCAYFSLRETRLLLFYLNKFKIVHFARWFFSLFFRFVHSEWMFFVLVFEPIKPNSSFVVYFWNDARNTSCECERRFLKSV